RHMNKGQQAMAVAMIYPEPKAAEESGAKGGRTKAAKARGSKIEALDPARGLVHPGALSQARAVLDGAPDLAKAVLSGDKSLTAAFDEMQERQGTLRNESRRLRQLAETRPDLAEKVKADDLDLLDAEQQAKKDADARKQQR